MAIEIRTGNSALADAHLYTDPRAHDGQCIPLAHASYIPDHQWGLFVDGRIVGRLHDIGPSVGADMRKALAKGGRSTATPPVVPEVVDGSGQARLF